MWRGVGGVNRAIFRVVTTLYPAMPGGRLCWEKGGTVKNSGIGCIQRLRSPTHRHLDSRSPGVAFETAPWAATSVVEITTVETDLANGARGRRGFLATEKKGVPRRPQDDEH